MANGKVVGTVFRMHKKHYIENPCSESKQHVAHRTQPPGTASAFLAAVGGGGGTGGAGGAGGSYATVGRMTRPADMNPIYVQGEAYMSPIEDFVYFCPGV